MNVLYLSRWFPYPPDNGARIRTYNLLRQLAVEHTIDLVTFVSEPVLDSSLEVLRSFCRRVEMFPYRSFRPNSLTAAMGFLSPTPRSVLDTHNCEMQETIERLQRSEAYDLVIASTFEMASYAQLLPAQTPKIWEEIELAMIYDDYNGEQQALRRLRHGLTWWKTANYTKKTLGSFQGYTVVTEQEKAIVSALGVASKAAAVIPNGVDIAGYAGDFGAPEQDTLIYAGALSYQANFDAMHYFIQEIFPKIQMQRPQVKLFITGRTEGIPIHTLPQNDGVVFTGYLEDVRPAIARSWVSIVPLRIGGGSRLKILESLALGTPVVSTSKGAEGLNLTHNEDILIADGADAFAEATLQVLADAELRARLSRTGNTTVAERYDWQHIGEQYRAFINTIGIHATGIHATGIHATGVGADPQ